MPYVKIKHGNRREEGLGSVLQIGICDDEKEIRLSLRWMLERLLEERGIRYHILGFPSGEMLLNWLEVHRGEMDLVFLDIEMGKLNGMETAKKIRISESALQIVFVTGYADFVFDGYSVGALDYLLKPPKREQLSDIVNRTLAAICKENKAVYSCRNGENWYRIPHQEILYFESEKRQVRCVTPMRSYTFYGKLNEVQQELSERGFVRIHQRYLVRAEAVKCICGSEVQVGEYSIPISRSYHQEALIALTRMTLGE